MADSTEQSKNLTKSIAQSSKISSIDACSNPSGCVSLENILSSFNTSISEDQAWAIVFQMVLMYKDYLLQQPGCKLNDSHVPNNPSNLNIHKDGSVHVNFLSEGRL